MSTTDARTSPDTAGTVTRLLQRQILPIDRDTDVFPLYVDLEEAKLDTDRHAVGGDKAAKDLNNAAIRQSTSTGKQAAPRPDPLAHRAASSGRRSRCRSAPTSTPSRPPTGAVTPSSPTST